MVPVGSHRLFQKAIAVLERSPSISGMRFKLTLTFAATAALLSGCVAYHIPTAPAASTASRVPARQLTLGIERSQRKSSAQYPSRPCTSVASQEELITALRARGFFKEVDFVDRLSTPPDLVVKDAFMGTYRNAYDSLALVLSLGIIPQPRKTPYLLEFQLADRAGTVVSTINTEEEDPSIVGWVALPMKLHSEWSGKKIDREIVTGRFAAQIEKAAGAFADRR